MDISRIHCLLLLCSLVWGVGEWFGPAVASASCGDYVHIGGGRFSAIAVNPAGTESFWLREREIRVPRQAEMPEGDSRPKPEPGRCHGPSCRSAIPLPPLSTPTESEWQRIDLVYTVASDIGRNRILVGMIGECEAIFVQFSAGRWERPPRTERWW